MDDQNQVEIPASFLAIYSRNGRPVATRADIEARYDLCEDMAIQTSEFSQSLYAREELSEATILRRCHEALRESDAVGPAEADWVIFRAAELSNWRRPDELVTPPPTADE